MQKSFTLFILLSLINLPFVQKAFAVKFTPLEFLGLDVDLSMEGSAAYPQYQKQVEFARAIFNYDTDKIQEILADSDANIELKITRWNTRFLTHYFFFGEGEGLTLLYRAIQEIDIKRVTQILARKPSLSYINTLSWYHFSSEGSHPQGWQVRSSHDLARSNALVGDTDSVIILRMLDDYIERLQARVAPSSSLPSAPPTIPQAHAGEEALQDDRVQYEAVEPTDSDATANAPMSAPSSVERPKHLPPPGRTSLFRQLMYSNRMHPGWRPHPYLPLLFPLTLAQRFKTMRLPCDRLHPLHPLHPASPASPATADLDQQESPAPAMIVNPSEPAPPQPSTPSAEAPPKPVSLGTRSFSSHGLPAQANLDLAAVASMASDDTDLASLHPLDAFISALERPPSPGIATPTAAATARPSIPHPSADRHAPDTDAAHHPGLRQSDDDDDDDEWIILD